MPGIRAEVALESPAGCPVAAASESVEGPLTGVTWTRAGSAVTEQFTAAEAPEEGFEEVFDYGGRAVYEFERDRDRTCACEHIERSTGPVTAVHARDGRLHVTVLVNDVESLRAVLEDLRGTYGAVSIEYLVRGRDGADEEAVVPVDLARLTDRQREVIETAHEMGYFAYPRDANAQTVSERLDIEPSTFAEHLAAAQSKLLDELTAHG